MCIRDRRAFVGRVAQDAADVGHGDEALGAQAGGDARGGGIGVDVVGVALAVAAHGGDDGNVALLQHVEDGLGVDVYDFTHVAVHVVERCV